MLDGFFPQENHTIKSVLHAKSIPLAGIPPYDGRDRIVQSERLNVQH